MIEQSRIKKIHFVGIGGAGMSGIAEVLANMGFTVSGSDLAESETVRRLREKGLVIAVGHRAENVREAEVLVYSSAVDHTNPEVARALQRRIPVIPRAEMLAELMRMKYSVAVAGTHGKTTSTSMIAVILGHAGLDPTYVVGGRLNVVGQQHAGGGARLGSSQYLVAEADESDGSFLKLLTTVAVITNIENDHLDHYRRMSNLRRAFVDFANKVPFYGAVAMGVDCPNVRRILPEVNKKVIPFGLHESAAVRAVNVTFDAFSAAYDLILDGRAAGRVELAVGGRHNVLNSLAALAAAREVGIEPGVIRDALRTFVLPDRRFQVLYRSAEHIVVDDYAHHPSEIAVTLQAMRQSAYRRIIAVFQPHRFTRLKLLLKQFPAAFRAADVVMLAPLYAASQQEIENVNSTILAEEMRDKGCGDVRCLAALDDVIPAVRAEMRPGDALVFLSAGNLNQIAHRLAGQMKEVASS